MTEPEQPGAPAVPSPSSTVMTLARITLKRLGRGKALWIGAGIAALPAVAAVIAHARRPTLDARDVFLRVLPLLAVLPAIFVASSLGEELEQRTSTYLWSRPIARWAVPAGKLCALVPIVIALTLGGWYAAVLAGTGSGPPLGSSVALAAGCLAISLVATGIAVVVPRYAMALTIGYALVDAVVGWLPFSLSELSITHQVRVLANLGGGPAPIATPVLAMAVVSGLWGAVGLVRIQRTEV